MISQIFWEYKYFKKFLGLGTWWLNDTSYGSPTQYLHCHGGYQNALTHSGWVFSRRSVHAFWQPPDDFIGNVVFRATVVEDFKTYWKNIVSEIVNVVRTNEVYQEKEEVRSTTEEARPTRPTRPTRTEAQLTRKPRQKQQKQVESDKDREVQTERAPKLERGETSENNGKRANIKLGGISFTQENAAERRSSKIAILAVLSSLCVKIPYL